MEDNINSKKLINTHSILIAKKGKIIYEKYFDGYNASITHDQRSASKSITSAITGIAIDNQLNVRKVTVHIATGEQKEQLSSEILKTGSSFSKTKQQSYKTASILGNTTYDLIKEIAKNAHITRKTATAILTQIKPTSFIQFKENPEHFITEVSRLIIVATLYNDHSRNLNQLSKMWDFFLFRGLLFFRLAYCYDT